MVGYAIYLYCNENCTLLLLFGGILFESHLCNLWNFMIFSAHLTWRWCPDRLCLVPQRPLSDPVCFASAPFPSSFALTSAFVCLCVCVDPVGGNPAGILRGPRPRLTASSSYVCPISCPVVPNLFHISMCCVVSTPGFRLNLKTGVWCESGLLN